VHVADPAADAAEARHEYDVELTPFDELPPAEAVVLAVAHRDYLALGPDELGRILKPGGVVVDVKACLPREAFERAGFPLWRL